MDVQHHCVLSSNVGVTWQRNKLPNRQQQPKWTISVLYYHHDIMAAGKQFAMLTTSCTIARWWQY